MIKKVLILTEAGKNIGFGHYTRCSALKQAFEAEGVQVNLVVFFNEFNMDDRGVIVINWLVDLDALLKYRDCTLVIVDSYLAVPEIYHKLRSIFGFVVAIDDYNRISYDVNAVINPNVFFDSMDYSNQPVKCFGGKDYVILRSVFREAKLTPPAKPEIEEILITVGGDDFRNILPAIINACLERDAAQITVVAPGGTLSVEQNQRLSVLPAQNADLMCKLMQRANVVISACGQTLHELAALGKATIGICLDIDQIPNQTYYFEQGFLPFKISWDDLNLGDKIKSGIAGYESLEKRKKIAANSPLLIDKNGVLNIVSLLKDMS